MYSENSKMDLRYKNILKSANLGTWEWNLKTNETIFNERWAQIIGYTIDEISPISLETWKKYSHPEDLKKSFKKLASYFDGKIDFYECTVRMKHKNGEWIWVKDRGQILSYDSEGKPEWMVGTHEDVTEFIQIKVRLEEALEKVKKSEKKLNQAQRIAKIGHWEFYHKENKIVWSDELFRIFDISKNEFGFTYNDFENLVHPNDVEYMNEEFSKHLKYNSPFNIEYRLLLKNKSIKHISSNCETIFDENDLPILSIGTVSDLTDRIENELKISEANDAKNKLFSVISHDLKSPFQSLIGLTSILSKNIRDNQKEKALSTLAKVNESSVKTLDYLENLLEWTKSQTNRISISTSLVLFDVFLENLINKLSIYHIEKNIIIQKDYDKNLILEVDENILEIILKNLLSNAYKFSNKNDIVTVKVNNHNSFYNFSIKDNGVGMSEEYQRNLFNSNSLNISTKGTSNEIGKGLGLLICKDFISILGGEIWVESEINKGSTFFFTIPFIK